MSETEPKYNLCTMLFDDDGNPAEFLIDGKVAWRANDGGCYCGNEECDRVQPPSTGFDYRPPMDSRGDPNWRYDAPSPTNPKHYAVLNPQPWDVIEAWGMDYFSGSVLKYLSRWRNKNGLEDLLKARTFLDKLIAIEGGK